MAELKSEDVALSVDGTRWRGWTDVRIRRSLDSLCGTFDLGITIRAQTGGEVRRIAVLSRCVLNIGGEPVIAGVIDRRTVSIEEQSHDIGISGRDAAADLVDCSAIAKPGSWRNASLKTIAEALVGPFGIGVSIDAGAIAPVRRFAIQPGETVANALERLNRLRGLVAWSQADGSIRIGNPVPGQSVGALAEGADIIAGSVSHDVTERYSQYTVKGQASGDDETHGKAAAQIGATATDPAITRYRPLVLVAEDQADAASLRKRASWEANVRAARGQTVSLTVAGWRDSRGSLWAPAAKVRVTAPSLDVDGEMMVISAELVRDDQSGTITTLELQRPEAWQQLAVPETADASSIGKKAA